MGEGFERQDSSAQKSCNPIMMCSENARVLSFSLPWDIITDKRVP